MNCCVKRETFFDLSKMEIILKDITKTYKTQVLHGLSYTFESGKLYVVKGVSGCGKTTLLNIIGGIDREYEGECIRSEDSHIGYLFQQSLLLSSLTVRQNLLLIRYDAERIQELADELGIGDLMDRKPATLSGGERQRVSILRALLRDPDILLSDEPTASLDGKNSEMIAHAISELKSEDRILIVATHDTCFDAFADEIIELNYGTIGEVRKNTVSEGQGRGTLNEERPGEGRKDAWKAGVLYVSQRLRALLALKNLLLTALFFFLILVSSSVQNNIASEAVRIVSKEKPVNLLRISKEQLDLLTEKDRENIIFYEDYYAEEGGWTAYYLLSEEYSVLNLPGMLSYGMFPKKNNEVLVNESLAGELSEGEGLLKDVIGKTVFFCGEEFTISGIVGTYKNDFRLDYYYCYGKDGRPLDFNDKHLFIPYESLKSFGIRQDRPVVMAVWPGLFQNQEARSRLERAGFEFNQYYLDALNLEKSATIIEWLLYGVLVLLFLIACIYSSSIIRLELFYRRKELGYLQIFGVSMKRILKWITMEYGVKTMGALLVAIIAHLTVITGYAIVTGAFALPNIVIISTMITLLSVFQILGVMLTIKKFLKQDIVRLIV